MQPVTEPWKKISLTQQQLHVMYREWGVFYTRKQKLDIATDQFDVSLGLNDNDAKAFFNRSRCKRSIADNAGALRDAVKAAENDPMSQLYNLEVCDALYRLNLFEENKYSIFNRALKFHGCKLDGFRHRSEIVDEDFNATVGDSMGHHILENEKYFYKAQEMKEREKHNDKRPLFKILQELGQCDVISVLEQEKELIHPRELARRKRSLDKFLQIYLGRSWVDMLFLKELRNHPILLLQQSKYSAPMMKHIIKTKYDVAFLFLDMLHARYPLYTHKFRHGKTQALNDQRQEVNLNRIQYQVHRNMLAILKRSTHLKESQKIQKLTQYVEEVMGDYVVLKTHRVLPWKFEFINEVYNILALALIDYFLNALPHIRDIRHPGKRLDLILKLPQERSHEEPIFVFGEKPKVEQEYKSDDTMRLHKNFIIRMKNRLVFSKHGIERSYLCHEIARTLFKASKFDKCCIWAQRCIEEAEKCKSNVWILLGLIVICRSHAFMHKIEKINDILIELKIVAKYLKDKRVNEFVHELSNIVVEEMEDKKIQEENRGTKSFHSKETED